MRRAGVPKAVGVNPTHVRSIGVAFDDLPTRDPAQPLASVVDEQSIGWTAYQLGTAELYVQSQGPCSGPPDGDDSLLVPFPDAAHGTFREVHTRGVQVHGL